MSELNPLAGAQPARHHTSAERRGDPIKVLSIFGTRPELIKLAPVLAELDRRAEQFRVVNVLTSQHTDLLEPFQRFFSVQIDHDLAAMSPGAGLNELCARVMAPLDPILSAESPDLVLVQGDTTSAMAGALAARYRRIPVGHVEAGLRSNDLGSPFPEEINRRMLSLLATYHFAATQRNVENLLREGVPPERIALTGNPVVDALCSVIESWRPSPEIRDLLSGLRAKRIIALTTHRRESFGARMKGNLEVLRRFVDKHADVVLVFPVHPNPAVRAVTREILSDQPRIMLVDPLNYPDFLHLLKSAWLVVSDSGGVQEEVPTLGTGMLILRDNTERPEAVECGVARLVGGRPERLAQMLDDVDADPSWLESVKQVGNPFGRGDSAVRIADAIGGYFGLDILPSSARNRESVV